MSLGTRHTSHSAHVTDFRESNTKVLSYKARSLPEVALRQGFKDNQFLGRDSRKRLQKTEEERAGNERKSINDFIKQLHCQQLSLIPGRGFWEALWVMDLTIRSLFSPLLAINNGLLQCSFFALLAFLRQRRRWWPEEPLRQLHVLATGIWKRFKHF